MQCVPTCSLLKTRQLALTSVWTTRLLNTVSNSTCVIKMAHSVRHFFVCHFSAKATASHAFAPLPRQNRSVQIRPLSY
ncbi:hypothetical protein B1Q45_19595 [Salmonella enterica]|uniref:Uncharacterized protein n=4 Tax=Salmonella enterica TaxID=28901 RepID=A0A3J4P144_SALER|nr:hypothetical protein [Salmonella enterica]EAO5998304.1 hypothetical protein [Salmonella enterica subsp. arizonae serovar 62:z36:-]EAV6586410.1 hypothetical protein [Salmonella enterica subsp. arizonae serovar 63:z4,z23:-]EAW2113068.1 hypothetical protein [Salmonella enterica subsp. enterica]EBH9975513.1 hypothetical protein [Salmonella enterica subsp. arizonae serovar 40:z36:-]EBV8288253.1 hypothetical protein [Salmonella enterica subsp. arizonae serovar 18:z4,z23:-]EBV9429304.1 hypothetic